MADVKLIAKARMRYGPHWEFERQPGETFTAPEAFAQTYIKLGAAEVASAEKPLVFRLPQKIADALGVSDDVSGETLRIVLDDLKGDPSADVKIPSSLRKALNLEDDATVDQVVARIDELKEKRAAAASKNAAELVDEAIAEGRARRTQRAMMLHFAATKPARFVALMAEHQPHPISASEEFQGLVAAEMRADARLDAWRATKIVAGKYPEIAEEIQRDHHEVRLGDGSYVPRSLAEEFSRNRAGELAASVVREKMAADPQLSFTAALTLVGKEHPDLVRVYHGRPVRSE